MKRKVIILGAGIAGLSAAAYLADFGFHVEVLESSPKIGGRAYSLRDKSTGSVIDNGQHILMGCYNYTLNFLKLIGADKNFIFQENLKVPFIKENVNLFPLQARGSVYPFNLLTGLLNYKAISLTDRLHLLRVLLKLHLYSSRDLDKLNIDEWLNQEGQSDSIKKAFWEILAVGALNTNLKKASARIFVDILKEIFSKGNKAATIVLTKEGLSESYCIAGEEFIKSKQGVISTGQMIQSVIIRDSSIKALNTSTRVITDFDYIISALPSYALKKILPPDSNISFPDFEYSSILSVHIWLKENNLTEEFYGFINSPVHWVFNHKTHITIVISDAGSLIEKTKEEVFELVSGELQKYLNINCQDISSYKVIKEKRATFVPSNDILKTRPGVVTAYNNFFLAGDWINTGLPSTIESAAKSGRMAADKISDSFSSLNHGSA